MTLRLLSAVLLALVASWTAFGQSYTISTIAGGLPVNVPGISASLYSPAGVAVDKAGNVLFTSGNCVFRLDAATGVLTAVAGNGTPGFGGDDGLAVNAELNQPQGLAVDSAGNLFIADMRNARVRLSAGIRLGSRVVAGRRARAAEGRAVHAHARVIHMRGDGAVFLRTDMRHLRHLEVRRAEFFQ